jgi:hypothetical protein
MRLPTFVSFVGLVLALHLTGCAEFWRGARTAQAVAENVCAVLATVDRPEEAQAVFASALRDIVTAEAAAAEARGRGEEARALLRSAEAAMLAARTASEGVSRLAGTGGAPVVLPLCVAPAKGPLPDAPAVLPTPGAP